MKLIDKLPYFYEECPKVNTIQNGLSSEANILYSKVNGTVDQLYINTTTWALGEWEKFAGIKKTDGTLDERRARVEAKLRARGTTTLDVMTALCKVYADDVRITEIYNEYVILLELFSTKEPIFPKVYDFRDMDEAIWEIKPAHLAHKFDINDSRKLNIKTSYEDASFRYIPCNSIYAGDLQPNTYFKEKEILVLEPSMPFEKEVI